MTNQELFDEFRKAENVQQRNAIFTTMYFRRKNGTLSPDEVPEDLEHDLCMLYDDAVFSDFSEEIGLMTKGED